jgi:hypothetical protein
VHGQFDDNMTFSGTKLTVCGPLFFNGTTVTDLPASQISILALIVVQPTAGPTVGHALPTGLDFTPPATEWMSTVSGSWVAGPASALATVQLVISGRKRTWIFETWSETITIFEAI